MQRRWRSISLAAAIAAILAPIIAHADEPAATQPTTADTPAPATQPSAALPTTLPSAQVEQFITALSADDWTVRHHSADVLTNLGNAIAPRLRTAVQTEQDVEARSALLGVLQQIEEAERTGPTRITLHAHDVPAIDVLTQIGQQTSFPISVESTAWMAGTRITLDADSEPFWSVMQKLAPQWPGHLAISTLDRERITLLPAGNSVISSGSIPAGPTMLCPLTLQSTRLTDLTQPGAPARFRSLALQATVLVEPKLRVSLVNADVQEALDEHGKQIVAGALPVISNGGIAAAAGSPITIRLTPPPDVGTMIARLKGTLRLRVPARRQVEETPITGMDVDIPFPLAGVKGTARISIVGDAYQLTVTLDNNAASRMDMRDAVQSVTLIDSAGEPLLKRPNLPELFGRPAMHFMFAKESTNFGRPSPKGPPVKIVSPAAGETRQMSQPFEMKNIPLTP